jgi:hypothetical protein
MGFADAMLFAILALADMVLLVHLHRRRQRRRREQRMMSCLRSAAQREIDAARIAGAGTRASVLQQVS